MSLSGGPTAVLLAGFDAFPGAPVNPTAELARAMARDGICQTAVLPTEWARAWPMLRAEIERARPGAVLLFGLHRRAERLRLELRARNHRELGRADAAGDFPSGPSVMEGPEWLPTTLPIAPSAAALREAGVSFEWSSDAGDYLCNDTLYRLAAGAGELGVRHVGFVHAPLTDECVADALKGASPPPVFCSIPRAGLERAARALVSMCEDALAGRAAGE